MDKVTYLEKFELLICNFNPGHALFIVRCPNKRAIIDCAPHCIDNYNNIGNIVVKWVFDPR